MDVIQALFLGVIQGLTEFLPVSSSGHLIFIPKLFGWADQGVAFDTVVHWGTLVAVIAYFRKRLLDRKLGWLILLSAVPAGAIGFFWWEWIENTFRSVLVVGVNMIFWGVVLWIADQFSKKQESKKTIKQTSWRSSLFIGCAQAIALIPGVSRSGITMTAGLFSKLDKKSAAEFSFLMSVPIIFLAGLSGIFDFAKQGTGQGTGIEILPLSIGFMASAVSGFIAIWGLMKIIQKWSYTPFVVYRIIIGILILAFLL